MATHSTRYPLIIGASGLTGTEIIRQLSDQSVPVRVTYREQAELNTLRGYGVEPFYADFEQPDTIANAMTGVDGVIAIMPIHPKFENWGKLAIDSAKARGVSHYIALSNFAVDHSQAAIARMHLALERHLHASGLAHTIIRPSTYFQNLLWATITIVRQQRFSLPMENAKIPHIDMRDVASAIIRIAAAPTAHNGKTYTLTGGEALSMFDIARLLSDTLQRKIRYFPTPLDHASDSFRDMGMIEWISHAVSEIYLDYATLNLSTVTDDFQSICARAPAPYHAFIQEHAHVFAGSALT